MGSKSKRRLAPVPPAHEHAYEVGMVLPVPAEALAEVAPAIAHINDLHRQLGVAMAEYEARRGLLLRTLAEQQQGYGEQVKRLGIGMGLRLGPDSNEKWLFNPEQKTFTRQV